jgi:hypothetical protein
LERNFTGTVQRAEIGPDVVDNPLDMLHVPLIGAALMLLGGLSIGFRSSIAAHSRVLFPGSTDVSTRRLEIFGVAIGLILVGVGSLRVMDWQLGNLVNGIPALSPPRLIIVLGALSAIFHRQLTGWRDRLFALRPNPGQRRSNEVLQLLIGLVGMAFGFVMLFLGQS